MSDRNAGGCNSTLFAFSRVRNMFSNEKLIKGGFSMKLKVFDWIALGISALGAILLGVSNMRHASESAIEQVKRAYDEAEENEPEGYDEVDF